MRLWQGIRSSFLWVILTPGILFCTGVASNQIVQISNHGAMPVLLNEARLSAFTSLDLPKKFLDTKHIVMTPNTHLNILGDVFIYGDDVSSIGDGFITAGSELWEYALIVWITLLFKKCWDADAV